jgi:chemotaxis protein histidine kinase CheA/CheY-like chemotaxis protein
MLPEQQQRILGYFIEEAKDHLNTIEQGLLNLQATLNDPEMVNEVFRAAHSIKGGAAMLGLSSIQHTSHRLEDCFKILKEYPIEVDQKLESLFLGVSDTLKALLEQLQSPIGLSEEVASDLMSEAEPLFQWLHEHLEVLVKQSSANTTNNTSKTLRETWFTTDSPIDRQSLTSVTGENVHKSALPTPATSRQETPQNHTGSPTTSSSSFAVANTESSSSHTNLAESDSEQQIQTEVINILRDMLQLFKQPATPESRQHLQMCCQRLANLGHEPKWSHWSDLCHAAGRAIASPQNTYLTLAKIVIIEIKQALELGIAGREAEITVSQQLASLISVPEIELLEIDLDNQPSYAVTEQSNLPEPVSVATTANIDSNSESIVLAQDNQLLEMQPDSISSLSDISIELDSLREEELSVSNSLDPNSPEVGVFELNSLADLFEGETTDLDETWEQVEILDLATGDQLAVGLSNSDTEDTDNQFHFLLEEKIINKPNSTIAKEEELTLVQLFGDELIEENIESQNSENVDVGLVIEFSNEYLINKEDTEEITETLDSNSISLIPPIEELESILSGNLAQVIEEIDTIPEYESLLQETIENKNNWNEIVTENAASHPVAEINHDAQINATSIPPQDKISSLEELFFETQKEPEIALITEELTSENLLDALSISINLGDVSEQDETISHFWQQDTQEDKQGEINSVVEEDAAKALEEILLAAASDDIFGDSEQPIISTTISPILEDIVINFPATDQINLSFLSDTGDDFFALPNLDQGEASPDILDSSQQNGSLIKPGNQPTYLFPEPLELMPEFTTAPTNNSQLENKQLSHEIELDWLDNFESEDIDSLQIFDEIDIASSNELNSKNEQFAEHNQDVADDLFSIETYLDSSLKDDLSPSLENLETVNLETIDNLSVVLNFSDINVDSPAEKVELGDSLSPMEIDLKANRDLTELDESIETLLHLVDDEIDDLPNIVAEVSTTQEITSPENPELTTKTNTLDFYPPLSTIEIVENEDAVLSYLQAQKFSPEQETTVDTVSVEDDFAELDELLNTSASPIAEQEIAALKDLLDFIPTKVQLDTNKADINSQSEGLVEIVKGDLPPRPPVTRVPRFEQLMKVPVKHLDDLSNLVGELVVNRNTLEQDQERLRQSLDNLLTQVHQLSDVGARMQELYERSLLETSLLASRKNNGIGTYKETDRGFSELEMDRFTPFHTLSQEIIELIVRVRESASDIDFVIDETEQVARQFRQVTTQLQEGITRSRMEPFAEITTPLERGVRESAIKCGKQARLMIEGRETLIDKMILEHLKSPLTQLLNNAIAHGIETPEVRQAAGKPSVGVITVRAFHQGNQTIISVSDDGAGIDSDGVKAKALKMGIMTPEQVETMTHVDVCDLLFQPGFTTKDKEDVFAGRGVGLDVVLTRISEIRGTITIDSTLSKGTTFTIRLPLTLSICKALCCVSDKARIAFPMDGVEDTLDLPVKHIQHGANAQKFIPWRDTVLPFRPLKDLLVFNRHLSRGSVYGGTRDDDMISVVVVRSANTLIALQIDQVLSEQEIVIKQFEGPAPKPVGVAGATILGDGRIMPIADVLEIIDLFQGRISKQRGISSWEQKTTSIVPEAGAVKIDPTVLIVDDSITVRELLSITFNKAGYRVEQARDGQEAWDKLRSGLPCDIVFCDIEMPRCDGLELLSRIQKDPYLNHLPIAMLTSRGADKHRQMAIQLGASGYFTKPYLEEALLEAAGRMLKGEKLVN